MTRQRPTDDELQSMLSEGHFGRAADLTPADPIEPTPMLLSIDQIGSYDRNPRTQRNPLFDEIKDSIRHQGLQQPLVITRRPGAERYMVKAGGNTRLAVINELHRETGDPRHQQVHCLFEPWSSESEVLAAHLIENDTRGELTFIDKAKAVRELKQLIESETGETLTHERLAATLRARGYRIERSLLSRIDYAVDTLLPQIPEALRAGMGQPQIQRIRRLDRTARRIWSAHVLGSDPEFDQVFATLLARYDGDAWELDRLRRALEKEIAERAGEELSRISLELDAVMGGQQPDAGRRAERPRDRTGSLAMQSEPTAAVQSPTPQGSPGLAAATEPASDGGLTPTRSSAEAAGHSSRPRPDQPEQATSPMPRPSTPTLSAPGDSDTGDAVPSDAGSLRTRACVLATRIAQRNDLGDIVTPLGDHGAGFLVDFVFTAQDDDTETKLARATLWWFLATVAEQFHVEPATIAPHLPTHWADMPIANAVSTHDTGNADVLAEYALIDIGPLIGPSVIAHMDDDAWDDLVGLLNAYRLLKQSLAATGTGLWQSAS